VSRYLAALLAGGALAAAQPGLAAPEVESAGWQPRDIRYPGVIELQVDATDVERGIFLIRESIPVTGAGRLTLLFPKWVPGNHAPTAPIERVAGLVVRAGGKRLAWMRDPVDMHAFHVEVPRGVKAIEAEFQYLSATSGEEGRVVMTLEMMNLQWFSLALYPAGYYARQISFDPQVRLPEGWQFTTQLDVASRSGSTVRFKPVSFEALMDSPLFAGRHFRRFELGAIGGAPAFLDVVADAPKYLEAPAEAIDAHRRLVAEAGKLFGAPPFRRYNFMLGLTRELGGIGTEHLASSEDTRPPEYLSQWQAGALLPHEFAHAWNGKARRPADLWTPDFSLPMRNSMLWLYEGQTQFWSFVLAARSGLMTREQVLDVFARLAATESEQPGRDWRPLADTSAEFIVSRNAVQDPWPSWHRTWGDNYAEADLMWIEADGLIRELSGERRSLDDFARNFFKGGGERPSLYDFKDVVAALTRVQPYDWATFLNTRVHSTTPAAPAEWLRRSGYRLVFTETPTEAYAAHHKRTNRLDLRHSIGLVLRADTSGAVREVIWNGPAFEAGLVAGATILSVNGAKYDPELLLAAIQKNRGGGSPIRLMVNNRNRERAVTLDYQGGLRFPRLERISDFPDRLGALLKARSR
jgi:predicted metalloprotease with PDZ domain